MVEYFSCDVVYDFIKNMVIEVMRDVQFVFKVWEWKVYVEFDEDMVRVIFIVE